MASCSTLMPCCSASTAPTSSNKSKKALFDNIATLAAPDPYTVMLILQHADPHALFRLGESATVILHPDSASQAATHPIGTSPYAFSYWKKGWGVGLEKWKKHRSVAKVKMVNAVFRFISDPQEQALARIGGNVDVFFNIATQHVTQFLPDKRYQVLIGASSGKTLLAMNHRRAPLNDVRVRQAITYAIDRENLMQVALDGRGTSHWQPFLAQRRGLCAPGKRLSVSAGASPRFAQGGGRENTAGAAPGTAAHTLHAPGRAGGGRCAQGCRHPRSTGADGLGRMAGRALQGQLRHDAVIHVEPLDYQIYTDPTYYFGYDSAAFRALAARHSASVHPRERQRLFADIQSHLAADAANAWLFDLAPVCWSS